MVEHVMLYYTLRKNKILNRIFLYNWSGTIKGTYFVHLMYMYLLPGKVDMVYLKNVLRYITVT